MCALAVRMGKWLPQIPSLLTLCSPSPAKSLLSPAARGIGEMIAAGLLANGAKVYISSRKADQCDATAARLAETYGGECVSIPADLSTMEGIAALASAVTESETQVDILVNNAGVSWGAPIEEFPEKGWDKVFDTNVKGVFFLTQQLLPLLEAGASEDDPSRVVNIGSIDGLRAPIFDTHSYGPSKAAVHALTREMATKLVKRNIILNAIAPGPFPTWMLSTGVGGGGDVENTDWDGVARTNPQRRYSRRHCWVDDLFVFTRRRIHDWRNDLLRRWCCHLLANTNLAPKISQNNFQKV